MHTIFSLPQGFQPDAAQELFETILSGNSGLRVERIVSHGHTSPEGTWYDQHSDEWVLVLEGEASLQYEDGTHIVLGRGNHVFLPKHVKHRVARTSSPCVWLAIHGDELTMT